MCVSENADRVASKKAPGRQRTHDGRWARGLAMGCRQRNGEEEVSSDFASIVGSGNWCTSPTGISADEGSLELR